MIINIQSDVRISVLILKRTGPSTPWIASTRIRARVGTVIRGRALDLVEEYRLRLPELEVLLEMSEPKAVGSRFLACTEASTSGLRARAHEVRLVTESWSLVVGGSSQRHIVTADGADLVDEGFV
jgi:hypothetical protein